MTSDFIGTSAGLDTLNPSAPGIDLKVFLPEWPEDLPCQVQDGELWFAESPSLLEMAKNFCQDCPVRLVCLCGAMSRQEPWGVWGGEIFDQGVIVSRKRPRGRPRKSDRVVENSPTASEIKDIWRKLCKHAARLP